MKYKLLYTVIIPILLLGCGDNEDSLSPSNIDRDWFIIEDNPNDQVDHQRYLLYQEYRLPIFYNDTIGEAEIVHPHGGTYTHYEILQTFYIPSSLEGKVYSGHFSLCPPEKKNQLLPALSMLEKTIIPQISKKMYITSILLVDTLLVSTTGIGIGSPATNYKGFNTWIIGDIFKIAEMDEEEMKKYGINLLINLVQNNNTALSTQFAKLSTDRFGAAYSAGSTSKYFYPLGNGSEEEISYGFPFALNVAEIYAGVRLETNTWPPQKITDLDYLNLPEDLCPETFGILRPMRAPRPEEPKYLWLIPTQQTDYNDFCQALFEYTPTEFRAKYASFPVVLEKYELVKKAFEDFGFSFE